MSDLTPYASLEHKVSDYSWFQRLTSRNISWTPRIRLLSKKVLSDPESILKVISIPLSFSGSLRLAEYVKPYPACVISCSPVSEVARDCVTFVESVFCG